MAAGTSTPDVAGAPSDPFGGVSTISKPYRAGVPPLVPYFKELWARRQFAREMARSTMRASYADTLLGRVWDLLNPVFTGMIFYLLVAVISGGLKEADFFAWLMSGLFVFTFVSTAMTDGVKSIVQAGGIILNTPFPKALLPLSNIWIELQRFLLSMIILFGICLWAGITPSVAWFVAIPWIVIITLFAIGCSMMMACAQVYFRDAGQLIPYILRLWLYACPILWLPMKETQFLTYTNPLYCVILGFDEIIIKGQVPSLATTGAALAWTLAVFIFGVWVFMSRERDFAIRI